MSQIELNWRVSKNSRKFLDFVIDGTSFYDRLDQDLISPLGWFLPEHQTKVVERLLLLEPPDFADGRTSIFVCGECGDIYCGSLSAFIESDGDSIIWRDFVYQNNLDPDLGYSDDYRDLGPFVFDADQYTQTMLSAITLYTEQPETDSDGLFDRIINWLFEK